MVVLSPLHRLLSFTVNVTDGSGFTVMVVLAVALHPAGLVPLTVYVVFVPGATVIAEPVDPLLQRKDVPGTVLLTLILADAPLQIIFELVLTVSTGVGFTLTLTFVLPVHPEAVPVTVYMVVTAGFTLIGFVFAPLLQW